MNLTVSFLKPLLLLVTSNSYCFGAAYYLAPNGNDSNSGTLSSPWKTITRSARAVAPGDTVYLRGGKYFITRAQQINGANGTSTKPIRYIKYQNEIPTIITDARKDLLLASRIGATLLDISRNYYIFDGINFEQTEASRSTSIGLNIPNYKTSAIYAWRSNITIRNCSIKNMAGQGVHSNGNAANLVVENCNISGVGSMGVYLVGTNSKIRNNVFDGSRGYPDARTIQIQYATSTGNRIYGNVIKNGKLGGVVFSGRVSNNEVFNNVFINAGSRPGQSGYALDFYCVDGGLGSGNRFYNNTIIGRSNSALIRNHPATAKCNGVSPTTQVDIRDNIFYPSVGVPVGYSGSNLRNNIFFNISGAIPNGNFLSNPQLVNPLGLTADSAKVRAGSPAIDRASSSTLLYDFGGRRRPVGIRNDIGAFEDTGL